MTSPTLSPSQLLLSLPPNMARTLRASPGEGWDAGFATSDPAETRLGSGGGTAHLLAEAWRTTGNGASFSDWLRGPRKLMIHGGGQSRRLPAYAAVGKPFLPMPVLRHSYGQRMDQTLLDFQRPVYDRVLAAVSSRYVAMVTSGDVLLRFGELHGPLPDVDILALGMRVAPETAQGFGVFFSRRETPSEIAFFRQKPTAQAISDLALEYSYLVDTGVWLFTERAILTLMAKCGWDTAREQFAGETPLPYELYAQFGLALGTEPSEADAEIGRLSCAVVPLPEARFYHLGTNRQLIEAMTLLQNEVIGPDDVSFGQAMHPDQFIQNAHMDAPTKRTTNHTLWIENSVIPNSWHLAKEHLLTGVPANQWTLALEAGVCLDFVPIGETAWGVRVYGIDDTFSGAAGDAKTRWLGHPLTEWLAARGLDLAQAGIDPRTDIQRVALFPVLPLEEIDPRFLEWLWAAQPVSKPEFAAQWQRGARLSAHALSEQANLPRVWAQRAQNQAEALPLMRQHDRQSIFFQLDLEATAGLAVRHKVSWDALTGERPNADPLTRAQDAMFRAALVRNGLGSEGALEEAQAFSALRAGMVNTERLRVLPRADVLEDQILWGRSPVRLDLAGGWTDTPPYCLQHGGQVVNLAVNLNGQPPIQVFARRGERLDLTLRSIDLGVEERVTSYEALNDYKEPGSEFALAKAALALAGFAPEFYAGSPYATLTEQLTEFGSGLEISMLAAVPKGSGLGTSSILAATLLATLSEFCGLGWGQTELVQRTLVMEQMLTTGGGWQDPAGGVFPGIKRVQTAPGLGQEPSVHWLPEHLFREGGESHRRMLLYYTGLTRMAKTILQDIVRGMFLNSGRVLDSLARIRENADHASAAISAGDYAALCRAVARSWQDNQTLDAGTNPPAVREILDRIAGDGLAAAKLLGAGGGGYLLMLARDERAAQAIRDRLTQNPPNARARFVEFSLSQTGLQVTRS